MNKISEWVSSKTILFKWNSARLICGNYIDRVCIISDLIGQSLLAISSLSWSCKKGTRNSPICLRRFRQKYFRKKLSRTVSRNSFFYCRLKKFLVVGNYHAFFSFYNSQDETCQKLMNHYIDKVRIKFLVMACKTFGEKISFSYLGQNCAEDEDVLEAFAKE